MNKPILLLGGGASIPFLNSRYFNNHFSHGLDNRLEEIIKGNYSIGLNSFYKFGCDTTLVSFVDYQFYQDNYEALAKVPLIVGSYHVQLKNSNKDITHKNTILLKKANKYNGKNSIIEGVWCNQLVGIWALSLAIALGFKEIYLLGYDCCEVNGKTHFYQGVIDIHKKEPIYINGKLVQEREIWRGVGKKENKRGELVYRTSTYERKKDLNEKWFAPFLNEKDVKIYNVSPESAIEIFPKLTYDEFFQRVKNNHVWQSDARENIRTIIQEKLK